MTSSWSAAMAIRMPQADVTAVDVSLLQQKLKAKGVVFNNDFFAE